MTNFLAWLTESLMPRRFATRYAAFLVYSGMPAVFRLILSASGSSKVRCRVA